MSKWEKQYLCLSAEGMYRTDTHLSNVNYTDKESHMDLCLEGDFIYKFTSEHKYKIHEEWLQQK